MDDAATRVRIGSTVTDAEIEQMAHMLMKEKGAAPSDVADQIRSLLGRQLEELNVARLMHEERWQQRVEGRLSGGAASPPDPRNPDPNPGLVECWSFLGRLLVE
jgi:hypothetical protein